MLPQSASGELCVSCLGDAAAQAIQIRNGAKQHGFDWQRLYAFSVHNGLWTAFGLHPILNLVERLAPGVSMRAVATKTVLQLGVMDPLCYLPSVYLGNGLLLGQDLQAIRDKMEAEFWPTAVTMWTFWSPVTLVQFRWVPVRHQANFVNLVDAAWLILLSIVYNDSVSGK